MRDFKNRVAVVTGAASGIGRAIAERCAAEGMKVVLAGINEENLLVVERELRARGATVFSVRADVSVRTDVEALAQSALRAFGGVHLLFNNAGVGAGASVWESTWNDWEWVMGVNLWGVIHGAKIFTPIMLAQGDDCHIVNTASIAGLIDFHPSAAYQVTKHAVVALSENLYLSFEMQKSRVNVSVFCPGWVKTAVLYSDRNRPEHLQNPQTPATPELQAKRQAIAEKLEVAMPADVAVDHLFTGIAENRFYIFSDSGYLPAVEERMSNIKQGLQLRFSM